MYWVSWAKLRTCSKPHGLTGCRSAARRVGGDGRSAKAGRPARRCRAAGHCRTSPRRSRRDRSVEGCARTAAGRVAVVVSTRDGFRSASLGSTQATRNSRAREDLAVLGSSIRDICETTPSVHALRNADTSYMRASRRSVQLLLGLLVILAYQAVSLRNSAEPTPTPTRSTQTTSAVAAKRVSPQPTARPPAPPAAVKTPTTIAATASQTQPRPPATIQPASSESHSRPATRTGTPSLPVPQVAENGSYYGELNGSGRPKTVHVRGYYRKDGSYVRGHYRSTPRRR